MTAEKLHDAITLLPGDLVAAADRLRTAPRTRAFYWRPVLATAACFVLLLGAGFVFQSRLQKSAKTEAAAAAPMAPQMAADGGAPDLFVEEAAPEAPAEMVDGLIMEAPAAENGLSTDHSHRFAEADQEPEEIPSGYSGHFVTKIYVNGQEYVLHGADSAAMTDILTELAYDPAQICRCMAEFTVDTETLAGIGVNLSEAFARCDLGQAALTEQQVAVLRGIVDNLQ